jgi:hypothetical protein
VVKPAPEVRRRCASRAGIGQPSTPTLAWRSTTNSAYCGTRDREHFTLGKIVGDQWHPTLPCRSAERAHHRGEAWDGMIVATELDVNGEVAVGLRANQGPQVE